MAAPTSLPAPPAQKPDERLGLVLRVAFFAVIVWVGALVFESMAVFVLNSPLLGAGLGIFLTGLVANLLTIQIFDRRPLSDIGLGGGPASARNFVIGLLLSGVAAALLLSIPLLDGGAHLQAHTGPTDVPWSSLLLYLVVLLLGAAGEEAIFRGYAFQLMVNRLGAFATILPVALVFGLAHGTNPNATKLGILNTVLWGVLLGFAFVRSRDLWLPIGLHYGWNVVLPLFGTNLSGITIEVTRYTYRWDLAPLWSGGTYGPEGGLLTTSVVVILFFALWKAPIAGQKAAIATTLNEPDLSGLDLHTSG